MTTRWRPYQPDGPTLVRFALDNSFVRGLVGPIGSGKSTCCALEIYRRAGLQSPGPDGVRRSRWAVIRNTYPELRTTTIKTWHDWIPPTFGRWQNEGPPTHYVPIAPKSAHDAAGEAEVMFLALDKAEDIGKLLSLELTGAWINEARQVPEDAVKTLLGRVNRYPSIAQGGATWSGVIMDSNPPSTEHWWFKRFETQRAARWSVFRQPSGRSPQAENRKHLPPDYYERLIEANAHDPDWLQVYVDGKYGWSKDGKPVFPMFAVARHVAPELLKPIAGRLVLIGADAGGTPAAVIGQRTVMGQWRIIAELLTDLGPSRFAEMLSQLLAEKAPDHQVEGYCDPSAEYGGGVDTAWAETVRAKAKIRFRGAATNDIVPRLDAVRVPLVRSLEDGQPAFLVSPACPTLIGAMASGYRYRRMKVAGAEKYEDKPEKNEFSHVADALQYLMLGGGEYAALIGRDKPKFAGKTFTAATAFNP